MAEVADDALGGLRGLHGVVARSEGLSVGLASACAHPEGAFCTRVTARRGEMHRADRGRPVEHRHVHHAAFGVEPPGGSYALASRPLSGSGKPVARWGGPLNPAGGGG